jgi:hypothetical protein
MPYGNIAAEALERWREAERRMTHVAPNSPEWRSACLEAEDARQRYNDAVAGAESEMMPVPPQFEEASAAHD